MNRTQWLSVWGFALGAAASPYAIAQTQAEMPEQPMVQRSAGGIAYISGGASEDDRESMTHRQAEFPFTVKLSEPSGELAVADRLSVLTPQGSLLIVRDCRTGRDDEVATGAIHAGGELPRPGRASRDPGRRQRADTELAPRRLTRHATAGPPAAKAPAAR